MQVCAGRGIGADQVLDLVTALTDKSLLTVRYGPDGARYRMLEIIRAHGQERAGPVNLTRTCSLMNSR